MASKELVTILNLSKTIIMNNTDNKGKWFRFRFQLEKIDDPVALKLQKCTIMAYYRGRLDAHNLINFKKHEIEFKWIPLKGPKFNFALEAWLTPPPTVVFSSINEMASNNGSTVRSQDSLASSGVMAASFAVAGTADSGDTIDPPRPPQPPPPDMTAFTNA